MDAPINSVWFGLKILNFHKDCVSKFAKGDRNELIKDLIINHIGDSQRVVKIYGCGTASIGVSDSNNNVNKQCRIECQLDMPLGVAYDFGVRFLEVETTTCDDDEPHENNPGTSNAFTLLMNMSRNYSKLPDKRKESTGKDKIYNAVLADLDKQNVKFTPQQVGTLGKQVVSELTNILLELDPHHEAFSTRASHIPEMFKKYTGYNDYKSKHKRKPQLSSTILQEAAEKLARLLMLPYFLADRCKEFRARARSVSRKRGQNEGLS